MPVKWARLGTAVLDSNLCMILIIASGPRPRLISRIVDNASLEQHPTDPEYKRLLCVNGSFFPRSPTSAHHR